jgi:predicted dehydrogenase
MKKIRVGIVGIGFVGVLHLEALRRLGNIEVVAICDSYDIERKGKELFIENTYADFHLMIDNENLDFIHICTPNNSHYEIAKYAMNKSINIVLEKPMTYTIDEARELYYLAQRKKLLCFVNYHNRFYSGPAYVNNTIKKGEIGDVIAVTGYYVQDWMLYDTDYSWRLNVEESGKTRVVADIGSHWIDLVEYMTGLIVEEVFADFKTVYPLRKKAIGHIESFSIENAKEYENIPIETEDIASLLIRFNNGAIGNAIFSQSFSGKKNDIEILIAGKNASAQWSLSKSAEVIIGHRFKPNEIVTKDFLMMKELIDTFDYPSGHTEGYADQFKQVFKQVYNGNKLGLTATFYDGLRQMVINERIYESAKTQQWVKIKDIL